MRRPRWHWLALSPWLAGLVTSCVLLGWPAAASAQVRHRHVNMSAAETAGQAAMDTALRHEGSGGQARRAQIRYYAAVERRLARQEAAQDRRQAARAAARAAALASAAAKQAHAPKPAPQAAPAALPPPSAGSYSYSQLEALWVSAGGPAWAEAGSATIAECESGGNPRAYNPSGASGIYQILGQVVPGNIFDPMVNALNAVAKFKAAGDSFSPWVCQP